MLLKKVMQHELDIKLKKEKKLEYQLKPKN